MAKNSLDAPRDYFGRILGALELLSGETAAEKCNFGASDR
jgi:hypothetical protein